MKLNAPVFLVSAVLIAIFVAIGAILPDRLAAILTLLQDGIVARFGWFYILSVAFFLGFVLWLLISPYGHVRLGKDDDEPEYNRLSWFSMLFSAGMGIGLLFFSVAEPILHFSDPRHGDGGGIDAATRAMTTTFFHWGLHAWAIYIVVGLSLAYFAYRHDLPLTIRSALYPLLGERIHGPIGHAVDVMAVFGTLFGVATSLGLGVMQVNAGLDYLGVLPNSTHNQLFLIGGITLAATASVVSGVDAGIRRLSELNLLLGLVLLLFVFLEGPSSFLLASLVENVGQYASNVVPLTFRTDAFVGTEWQKSWTMFYWGWWISWSPFVGMFIARVSRGRTIREFVLGVLFVPTLLTFLWMVVFGNTAIYMELFGEPGMVAAVRESVPTALFKLLDRLPATTLMAGLATLVITTFFITSSDSGSLVIDILTSGGEPDPPVWQRIFWALTEGAVAAVLLLSGGLLALQTAALATALPFCAIMLLICWSLVIGLRGERTTRDPLAESTPALGWAAATPFGAPAQETTPPSVLRATERGGSWRDRLRQLLQTPAPPPRTRPTPPRNEYARSRITTFIAETVIPAFEEIREELARHGREGRIDRRWNQASLIVLRSGREEFSYAIRGHAHQQIHFAFPEQGPSREQEPVFRAEALLRSGQRWERSLDQFDREAVIRDFLDAYAKWMGW